MSVFASNSGHGTDVPGTTDCTAAAKGLIDDLDGARLSIPKCRQGARAAIDAVTPERGEMRCKVPVGTRQRRPFAGCAGEVEIDFVFRFRGRRDFDHDPVFTR